MSLEDISDTLNAVVFSPQPRVGGDITLEVGDAIEFLDFMVELEGTATEEQKADLNIYYTGVEKDYPEMIDQVTLWQGGGPVPELAGPTAALVGFKDAEGLFTRGVVSTTVWTEGDFGFNGLAEPVCRPFIIYVDYAGNGQATLQVYRWLQEGETFFVDGAEYDVSQIYLPYDGDDGQYELKHLTIRNPIPKGEGDLLLKPLTIWKRRVPAGENLPVLPPFDREHDIIDDVDIYHCDVVTPDLQLDDNINVDCPGEKCKKGVCVPNVCCEDSSYLHEDLNEIFERRIEDVDPLAFYWLAEEKEPRFDTNLLEEKYTIASSEPYTESWKWINIETLPWHYTEFVLPDIPDVVFSHGDYLLVSSWLTEDSDDEAVSPNDPFGQVRMKFAYDGYGDADGTMKDEAKDGLGIYVNHCLETVGISSLTSDSPVDAGQVMNFEAEIVGTPITYTWDFGDTNPWQTDGELIAGGEMTGTYKYAEAGEYVVTLQVENECYVQAKSILVEVLPLDADVDGDGDVDFQDVLEVLKHWGAKVTDSDWPDHKHADVDDDGDVDVIDILQVLKVYMGL